MLVILGGLLARWLGDRTPKHLARDTHWVLAMASTFRLIRLKLSSRDYAITKRPGDTRPAPNQSCDPPLQATSLKCTGGLVRWSNTKGLEEVVYQEFRDDFTSV